jgi:pyruvate kinase
MQRRTRIVATLGPATDRPGVLEAILEAGLDLARVNFSHGTADEHLGRIKRLRQLTAGRPRPLAVLADLPGPKLRALLPAPLPLAVGQEVVMAAAAAVTADIHVTEPQPIQDLRPGNRVLLDDGRVQMRAVHCERHKVLLRVEVGGTLLPNKGINLPDTPLSIPAVTSRDLDALVVVALAGVDWLALSFVRDPGAAHELRGATRMLKIEAPLLAKIERPEAVKRAPEIIEAFDGIMVARGDLGVEIPLEQVPYVQKRLIALARAAGKPVVTATDMLDSMRTNPRPTRAEASDVANAVFDGTDAVMLSGETAVGDYPVEAVACMDRIAREAESHGQDDPPRDVVVPRGELLDHITHLTVSLAREVNAEAIITPTYSGRTPRMVARHRPQVTIVAPSPHEPVLRQLAVVWGVAPVPLDPGLITGADRIEAAVRAAFAHGAVQAGTRAVVLAGHPVEGGEHFPTIRVVRVGDGGQSCEP